MGVLPSNPGEGSIKLQERDTMAGGSVNLDPPFPLPLHPLKNDPGHDTIMAVKVKNATAGSPEPLIQSREAGKGKQIGHGIWFISKPARKYYLLSARTRGFLMSEKTIFTAEDMRRALTRISHEITERNHGCHDLVLIGLCTRGVPLAQRMAAIMKDFEGAEVPVGALDIDLYRDDLSSRSLQARVHHTDIPTDISDKQLVLVDDVLYTGRSIRAAMDALMDLGRPTAIQLAVLIDRGHRELPIRPDYIGRNVPTSRTERIQVRLVENDRVDEVVVIVTDELSPHIVNI